MLVKEICNQQTSNYKFQELCENFLNTSMTENMEIRPLNIFAFNFSALKKVRVILNSNQIFFNHFFTVSTGCCECLIYFYTAHSTLL